MFFSQNNRKGENLAITRRRDAEDKRAAIQSVVDQNTKIGRMATWEHKTGARIEANSIRNLARTLETADKASVQERRRRLAALMHRDDEIYKKELAGLQETSTQRARRMVAVARALKLEREEKRKALAQEQYNRQWREGCDDLRLIDSDKFRNHCMQGVQQQLSQKVKAKTLAREDEMRWAKVMEDGRLQKLESEAQGIRDRQAYNYENKQGLMDQIENTRQRKAAEAQRIEEERQEFARAMEEEAEHNKHQNARMLEAQRAQLQRIKVFNDETSMAKARTLEMQRAQEMRDLAQKMEAHKAETNLRAKEKKQMREDIMRFQEYLRQRKAEEKQMERELEVLCQQEMERANAKRDTQWAKEKLAREQLLADVYEVRMGQIKSKNREDLRREEEVALERAAIERELKKAEQREEEEEAAQRKKEREMAGDLDRQMAARRNRQQIDASEARKEFEAAQEAEKKYSAFLKREKQSMWAEKYEPKSFGLKTIPWN